MSGVSWIALLASTPWYCKVRVEAVVLGPYGFCQCSRRAVVVEEFMYFYLLTCEAADCHVIVVHTTILRVECPGLQLFASTQYCKVKKVEPVCGWDGMHGV